MDAGIGDGGGPDRLVDGGHDGGDPDFSADGGALDGGRIAAGDERIGDPGVSYWNPEFSADGRYMVWFEPTAEPMPDGRVYGRMWQCGVDLTTGDLIPPDGRGLVAFPSTVWTRANWGFDRDGPYYVGQWEVPDDAPDKHHLVHVRPTGPMSAVVTVLSDSLPTERRRSIVPTALRDREMSQQFVWWLENDTGYTPTAAEEVTLKFVSLAAPSVEHVITRQTAVGPSWSPMDTTYVRLVRNSSMMTLGVPVLDAIEVATFDLASPQEGLSVVTMDRDHKLDPFPFMLGGSLYFLTGINGTAESRLYRAASLRESFNVVEAAVPMGVSSIAPQNRCQPQSHESFEFRGSVYSAYQIADCSSGSNFLTRAGEIWLASWLSEPRVSQVISDTGVPLARNEPESVVGNGHVWVFYTAYETNAPPLRVQYQLRRITLF